jgi:hypothetical protein
MQAYGRPRDGMVDITDLKSVEIFSLAGSSPAAGTIPLIISVIFRLFIESVAGYRELKTCI